MKQAEVITFTKSGEGFTTPSDTRQVIAETLTHRKEVNFKRITPKEARSTEQNNLYWGKILRLLGEYVETLTPYVAEDQTFNDLHRYLTFEYCLRNNRDDLCTYYPTWHNGERITVAIASWSFDKMSAKDANSYLSWLESLFRPHVGGLSFKEMLEREKMEVS